MLKQYISKVYDSGVSHIMKAKATQNNFCTLTACLIARLINSTYISPINICILYLIRLSKYKQHCVTVDTDIIYSPRAYETTATQYEKKVALSFKNKQCIVSLNRVAQ